MIKKLKHIIDHSNNWLINYTPLREHERNIFVTTNKDFLLSASENLEIIIITEDEWNEIYMRDLFENVIIDSSLAEQALKELLSQL